VLRMTAGKCTHLHIWFNRLQFIIFCLKKHSINYVVFGSVQIALVIVECGEGVALINSERVFKEVNVTTEMLLIPNSMNATST
jgi:hypothetical protein